ncbi:hypothetical protein V5O48_011734 [Marasmius crinis-equi]|uniref:Non-reducing end beta-L-arabinofuranosidase-like GH127 middle domain-containing protein n=1 Tax=Marasmius crinis-equi TaxID=585013 RepID=A0ABR3F4S6_9AGAR
MDQGVNAGCLPQFQSQEAGLYHVRLILLAFMLSTQLVEIVVPFKYKELPLGAVKPTADSWLLTQLQAQANGLHGHLQEFWGPVQNSKWIGGNDDYSALKYEPIFSFAVHSSDLPDLPVKRARTGKRLSKLLIEFFSELMLSRRLNGVVPTAFQLNDQRLLGSVGSWIKYIIQHQGSDGWLGPDSNPRVLWGRYPALLAMMQYAQANTTASSTVVNSMQKFFIGMNNMLKNGGSGLEEWGIMRWQDVSIALQWLLDNHPNGQEATYTNLLKLLRYGGANWKGYFTDGTFPTSAVNHIDIKAHGVNVVQAIKSEAVAYRYTHDSTDLDSTRKRIDLIERYHGAMSGVLVADEHLAGLHPSRGSELCTVVEQMYSYEYVYSVLGDNQYADKIERLAYNALPGTLTDDMWAHQYLQQSNQPWARHMDPSVFATDGVSIASFNSQQLDSNTFGLAPNYPCCTVNHGQGWAKFISHAYMTSSDASTLYHAFLSPTTVSTTLSGNNAVTVTAQTNYPFSSQIQYSTSASNSFKFGVRVPSWVSGSVTYALDGGNQQTGTANSDGYVVINVAPGSHTITVNIPMGIQTQSRFNGAKAVLRGPLVYSLDVSFNTTVLNTYALNSKDLRFDPTTSWQYAIDTSSLKYNGDATSLQSRPWSRSGAPVSITANACLVNWNVATNTADGPPTSPATCTASRQQVKLIPYGAAKLRMSEMPSL